GAREVQDTLAGPVPDHAVARVGGLGRRVLRVRVVDVKARPVGEDQVDEARLLLRGHLFVLHVLEAARVAQRALRLVVPADAGGPVGLVGVDQQQRGEDRVEVGLVLDRDAVFGLDPHHLRNRHGRPRMLDRAGGIKTYGGGGARPPPPPPPTETGRGWSTPPPPARSSFSLPRPP